MSRTCCAPLWGSEQTVDTALNRQQSHSYGGCDTEQFDQADVEKADLEKAYGEIRSGLSTPTMYSVNTSDRRSLDFQEKQSSITLRALTANATYASLFLVIEMIIFTVRNKEPINLLVGWRRCALLYSALWAVVNLLACIFTSVMYNWVLASLESLPPAEERLALKDFNTSFLGGHVMEWSSFSFISGVPAALFHCGLALPLMFDLENSWIAAGLLDGAGVLMILAAVLTYRYVRRIQSTYRGAQSKPPARNCDSNYMSPKSGFKHQDFSEMYAYSREEAWSRPASGNHSHKRNTVEDARRQESSPSQDSGPLKTYDLNATQDV